MIDVISSNGWLKPALLAMELSQMVTQAILATDSPLLQLPFFTPSLVEECKKVNVNDIIDFMNMDIKERNSLLQMSESQITQIALVCNRYPQIEMSIKVLNEQGVHAGEPAVFNVDLSRELENDVVPPAHAPYYPQEKEEYWWVVIGNPEQNKLLAIKRMIIPRKANTKLSFVVNDPGTYNLKAYLMCDSYIGVDQEEEIKLIVEPQAVIAAEKPTPME